MVLEDLGEIVHDDLEAECVLECAHSGRAARSREVMSTADGPWRFDLHPVKRNLRRALDEDSSRGEKDDPIDRSASVPDRLAGRVEPLLRIGRENREDIRSKSLEIRLRFEKECAIQG